MTFVVPFAAGSATDQLARALGQEVTRITKQAVVVDDKPGASGFIGAELVKKAAPDGYTVFITTNTTHAANEHLFKKLPYDPVKDFLPVTGLGKGGQIMIVNTSLPAKSVAEFIALAKSQPGKISFGSGSSSSRVAGEMFQQMAGIDLLHVPYKSNPLAINDLLGGQINMMITDMATGLPQVKGGKVRALGVSTAKRSPLAPELPTISEAGLKGYEMSFWFAAYVPANTPPAVVAKLHDVLVEATKGQAMQQYYTQYRNRPFRLDAGRARKIPGGRVRKVEEHHQEGRHRARIKRPREGRVPCAKRLRLGGGAGFAGDRLDAPVHLAEHGKLDYLVLECLAERTIALAQLRRRHDPSHRLRFAARAAHRVAAADSRAPRHSPHLEFRRGQSDRRRRFDRRHREASRHPGQSGRGDRRRCAGLASTSMRRRWKAAFRSRGMHRSCRPTRIWVRRHCCPRSRAEPTSWSPDALPIRRCSLRR